MSLHDHSVIHSIYTTETERNSAVEPERQTASEGREGTPQDKAEPEPKPVVAQESLEPPPGQSEADRLPSVDQQDKPAILITTPPGRSVREGIYLVNQKFGRPKDRQMTLAEINSTWSEDDNSITGITPTVEELKALSAILYLLEMTDYKGNLKPDYVRSSAFKWEGHLPNLATTIPEYLEAYGLARTKRGRFSMNQRERAIDALESLTRPKRVVLKRRRFGDAQKRYDVIATEQPLIHIIEGYESLTEEELQQVQTGARLERTTKIILQPAPLLMFGIFENFYLLRPANLHKQIEEVVAKDRGSKTRLPLSYYLFVEWLLTKNKAILKIDKEKLVDILLLTKYKEQRKLKAAYEQIDCCLEIAQKLEYLIDYEEDALGLITLRLNPAKVSRVKTRITELEPEAETAA